MTGVNGVDRPGGSRRVVGTLALLALAVLLAKTPWFSASAVARELGEAWGLGPTGRAWLTASVQLGFVVGALASAVANLADRFPPQRIFALSAVLAAGCTAGIALDPGPVAGMGLRFATGVALAGVYPPGMKLAASWTVRGRGLALGTLVAALTLGSATPHLLGALSTERELLPWRTVLSWSAGLTLAGACLVLFVRPGPHLARTAPFDWRHATDAVRHRPLRLANTGYLGHMWELYAMWTWVPLVLLESYERAGLPASSARLAGYAAVGSGAIGCVLAGVLADRLGRTRVAGASLVVSGACCLFAGLLIGHPVLLTAVCVVWGVAVVADSAQFSAAVSELADPRYVGTALSVQTSLGFLLTLATIFALPVVAESLGWRVSLPLLALGPVVGIIGMARLRRLPEATKMAGGMR